MKMKSLSGWGLFLLLIVVFLSVDSVALAADRPESQAETAVEVPAKTEGTTTEKFAQKSLHPLPDKSDHSSQPGLTSGLTRVPAHLSTRVRATRPIGLPTFIVTAAGAAGGDLVSVESRKNRLYIEVRKKSGIGSASIKLKSGQWPDMAQVRFFDFSRLEGFTAGGGAKVDCVDGGASKRRTFDIDLLPLHVDVNGLELNWVDAYRH